MHTDKIYDDIRNNLKKLDKRGHMEHALVPLILNLGVSKSTVAKCFEDEEITICRATVYNLFNSQCPSISISTENILKQILIKSTIHAVWISKNYRKMHKLYAIEGLNMAIKESKDYLQRIEPDIDIDFGGMFNKKNNNENNFIEDYVQYMGE
jgi:hypothetical protein